MERPALEVADIFRDFGSAWREANRGHVSHAQLKVMSAIGVCRTAWRAAKGQASILRFTPPQPVRQPTRTWH